jgi:plasmid stability protein
MAKKKKADSPLVISLPKELKDKVRTAALKDDRSVSSYVRVVLEAALK